MLAHKIERFLRDTGMTPTQFGRQAVGDTHFVFDLRNGREPTGKTEARVEQFITDQRKGHHAH